ncbi:sugar phosphate nucleotidyltransferase [Chloroflexota bacterium]
MILILTMAGRYTRFIAEGYIFPKYLLPWADKTILSKILYEMKKGDAFSDIILVANNRDEIYMPHVRTIMKSYDIDTHNLLLVSDTEGQAETALIGIESIQKKKSELKQPIVIHNIDTILYKRNYEDVKQSLHINDGYIDVFQSSRHDYSYVLVDEENRVIAIEEKMVISNLATSGLYGFSSAEKFEEFYVEHEDIYISSIYKKMIVAGERVIVGEKYSNHHTIVLGTPEEYINASVMIDTMPFA